MESKNSLNGIDSELRFEAKLEVRKREDREKKTADCFGRSASTAR